MQVVDFTNLEEVKARETSSTQLSRGSGSNGTANSGKRFRQTVVLSNDALFAVRRVIGCRTSTKNTSY
jgi:hypothetical protein